MSQRPPSFFARHRMALLPLAVFALIAAMFWGGLGRDHETLPSPLVSKPVPEFSLPGLREGEPPLDSALLRAPGVKMVNIWASWCGPCRVEHPFLMQLKALGVPVYGINYKDSRANALRFLEEEGDPFAQVGADEKGRAAIEWGVYGVPESFVVDGQGRIAYKHVGPIQNDDLETKILPALRAAGWQG
ncbi:DsbE family thiol:disulfide interchange protein [Oceanicella actignis]|uniref:Cytochrome c biogenesis protein CcmG, thiol:disulfide interchange protein DsbE n=1 Tax=Oceanicella actignis TaxID=1189325 RepID=A0A1M7TEC9_9RHOB|nr:DsbE family thiol:disulfide interchange protein [Oceanicella actignis]TYO88590.1 cytochrome c biogenesis protein CcmG/thiol:disulfide interchange protein DsbE [Oceanicella actignis]SET62343.1 cytochrome c biogenesis protein CcmG, thiol:disulfide interchange protein DsbE [Oceanicella actignis]SHN69102.1 cytochrome c biogenesis protein CcmG, thiol:disulfide interchange protein DsbE [Oceanicella actignis]